MIDTLSYGPAPTDTETDILVQQGYDEMDVLIRELQDAGQIGQRSAVPLADSAHSRGHEADYFVGRRGVRAGQGRISKAHGASIEAAQTRMGHPAMARHAFAFVVGFVSLEKILRFLAAGLGFAFGQVFT